MVFRRGHLRSADAAADWSGYICVLAEISTWWSPQRRSLPSRPLAPGRANRARQSQRLQAPIKSSSAPRSWSAGSGDSLNGSLSAGPYLAPRSLFSPIRFVWPSHSTAFRNPTRATPFASNSKISIPATSPRWRLLRRQDKLYPLSFAPASGSSARHPNSDNSDG